LIWLPVRLVCRSSISNMAFSLLALVRFFGGRRACAPAVRKGYPVNAGNGRAGAGEKREYYRPINKQPAMRCRQPGRGTVNLGGGISRRSRPDMAWDGGIKRRPAT